MKNDCMAANPPMCLPNIMFGYNCCFTNKILFQLSRRTYARCFGKIQSILGFDESWLCESSNADYAFGV